MDLMLKVQCVVQRDVLRSWTYLSTYMSLDTVHARVVVGIPFTAHITENKQKFWAGMHE